jgi:alpha-L-fucosidase
MKSRQTLTGISTCLLLSMCVCCAAQEQPAAPAAGAARGGRSGRGGGRGGLSADAVAKGATHKPEIPPGPFQPTWDSLRANWKPPEWFRDAKFGIFMHWGLYAVPAHGNEWYVSRMYNLPWQVQTYGPTSKFGYKDFIPLFTCEKYNPDDWAALFKKAGAKYIMPTAEHHDGFALWDSALTRWDAKDMGPKRDLIGDMAAAARKVGLKFCVSSHRWEHYSFVNPGNDTSADTYDPQYNDFYSTLNRNDPARAEEFVADWIARQCELIDKYQVDLLYWDNGLNGRNADPAKLKVAAYYYNRAREWGKEVGINTKQAAMLSGGIRDYERGRSPETADAPWQEDTAMGHNSWGYTEEPKLILRNAGEMIREMADCVSKNGNYLLNISPRADGTIPDDQRVKLLEIGEWLDQNGEAIYGTRPWGKTWGEGPTDQGQPNGERGLTDGMLKTFTARDMRFTTKGNTLYAIFFAYPRADEGNEFVITSLAKARNIPGSVRKVTILGPAQPNGRGPTFKQSDDGLHIAMPTYKPNDFAIVAKIEGLQLQ